MEALKAFFENQSVRKVLGVALAIAAQEVTAWLLGDRANRCSQRQTRVIQSDKPKQD